MQKRTVSKAHVKKERDPAKVKKVLQAKGYPSGKAPEGMEAHHKKPVALGGKTTPSNIEVVTKVKHKKIHAANRKKGGV